MGQKVNPIGFRLAVRKDWHSNWYATKKQFPIFLKEDFLIRQYFRSKMRYAAMARILIERAGSRIRVKILTGRPGMIIGRKGQELEKVKEDLEKLVNTKELLIDVQEVKKPDFVAKLVAENVAIQLERRISFRRAMKKAVQTTMSLGAEGIRIQCSGRLGGSEIARSESQRDGRVPLHTLRENIDYGFIEANTVYGVIGVKCWICTRSENNLK